MQLDGYLTALGQLPTYDDMKRSRLVADGQRIQNRVNEQLIVSRNLELQQQQELQKEFYALGENPTPERLRNWSIRFPGAAKPLLDAASSMEEKERQQVVREAAQIRATIDAGKPEVGQQMLQRYIDADIAANKRPDPEDLALLSMLKSGDPEQLKTASGMLYATISSFNPEAAAKNLNDASEGERDFTLGPGGRRYRADGTLIAEAPFAPEYRSVGEGETLIQVGGGDPASSGAAGGRGDTSRLINTDAGGGYVPASVQTLGQFVNFGRAMNRNGAKSSSAGIYQINGSTMADFAPRALGEGWQSAPFNAETQDRVGREIFNWAKGQPNPAAALRGRWVSLTPSESARLVQGGWEQARGLIAQKESGGGPGASASAPAAGGPRVIAQGAPKRGYEVLSPQEVASIPGLDPQRTYQRSPDGQITAVGGSDRGSLKPWPAGALDARTSNNATLTNIDGMIRLLDPKNNSREARTARAAIGPGTGFLGDTFTQWNNPEGTDARSRIGQIGGLIVKDTSGAAVSASEDQRLAKWVPMVTDKPSVALAKLRNLRREVTQRNRAIEETYSEDQGYRPFRSQQAATGGFRILRSRPK